MIVVHCNDDEPKEELDRHFPKELLEEWDEVCKELRRLAHKSK